MQPHPSSPRPYLPILLLLFVGSGYLSQRDLYRLGAVATAANFAIFSIIGTAWLWLVVR